MNIDETPYVTDMPKSDFPICPHCGDFIYNYQDVKVVVQRTSGAVLLAHSTCCKEAE